MLVDIFFTWGISEDLKVVAVTFGTCSNMEPLRKKCHLEGHWAESLKNVLPVPAAAHTLWDFAKWIFDMHCGVDNDSLEAGVWRTWNNIGSTRSQNAGEKGFDTTMVMINRVLLKTWLFFLSQCWFILFVICTPRENDENWSNNVTFQWYDISKPCQNWPNQHPAGSTSCISGLQKKNWSAFNKIYREGYKYHQKRCFDVLTRPAKRDSSLQSSEGWQNWMIYADVDNMVCGGTGKGVLTCYSKHEPQLVTLLTTTIPLALY